MLVAGMGIIFETWRAWDGTLLKALSLMQKQWQPP
jgi:hypothetical protein